MTPFLKVPALVLALAHISIPAQAKHFITLVNASSVPIQELCIGDFKKWDDLLKGLPNEVHGVLWPESEMQIHPVYHEEGSPCVANLIVTTDGDTVLVRDIDICASEIVLTDEDLLLDY